MLDWLRVEYEISEPGTRLQDVVSLDSDSLVAEVQRARGKKSRLSAAGLHSLRDKYVRTVEPCAWWLRRPCNWNTASTTWSTRPTA